MQCNFKIQLLAVKLRFIHSIYFSKRDLFHQILT